MNTRECLIIIKDKIKTSEVKKYQYNHDTQKMEVFIRIYVIMYKF